jgi:hypothetical protein
MNQDHKDLSEMEEKVEREIYDKKKPSITRRNRVKKLINLKTRKNEGSSEARRPI